MNAKVPAQGAAPARDLANTANPAYRQMLGQPSSA
jgi:hypothetical protein